MEWFSDENAEWNLICVELHYLLNPRCYVHRECYSMEWRAT